MALLLISAQGEWMKTGDSERERPKFGPLDWLGLSKLPNLQCAKPLGALLGAYLVLLFIVALGATMPVLMSTFSSLDADTGPSLGVGTLIIGVLGAPFLIWRTIVAQTTVDLAKENHVTDMINKAVEGLGAQKISKYQVRDESGQVRQHEDKSYVTVERSEPNIEVRIGAILALERLAKNNLDVHIQIMEILTAYIRENAKASDAEALPETLRNSKDDDNSAINGSLIHQDEAAVEWRRSLSPPRMDVALALSVIGRRSGRQVSVENGYCLGLRDTNLQSADLAGYRWDRALFQRSDLSRAKCHDASFVAANFGGAKLIHTDFQRANLSYSNLGFADYEGESLMNASGTRRYPS